MLLESIKVLLHFSPLLARDSSLIKLHSSLSSSSSLRNKEYKEEKTQRNVFSLLILNQRGLRVCVFRSSFVSSFFFLPFGCVLGSHSSHGRRQLHSRPLLLQEGKKKKKVVKLCVPFRSVLEGGRRTKPVMVDSFYFNGNDAPFG